MAGDSNDKVMGEQRPNLDATGEFFSVGAALHAVRAGYIRRRADDLLYNALTSGHYAHVVAPDRSGKSSLVAATAARLESNGRKVAILDLAQMSDRDGATDSGRWYYSIAYRLLRQLRIRYDLQSWWQDKSVLSNRQRLFEFYSEIILQHVDSQIVIFVDEIQCIEDLPYADQLLTSIRAAHNARVTDPDFSRLGFVLLGECDPVSLMKEAELSPFNVTQQVELEDFSRADLDMFTTELNLGQEDAAAALDRIYYWTAGQPYLSQKLARAVARNSTRGDVGGTVDRHAAHQLAGRAALHNEPHMSHIHRCIVNDKKRCEPLLNLYGRIRKGIPVPADLGSPLQRRLIAIGLLVIDEESNLIVRNRLYEAVFTARWANENLPTDFKVPAIVTAVLLLFTLIPFWYTQWLPKPYVRTLASDEVELVVAASAYENFRSFPGHAHTADSVYRRFLERRALKSNDEQEIGELAALATALPDVGRLPAELEAGFWDRRTRVALRSEQRDAALIAKLQSLTLATTARRQRAAALIGDDYPFLAKTLPMLQGGTTVFDPLGMVLTTAAGAEMSQFSYTPQGVQSREPWSITALEVSPLLRRVIVDREGAVNRIGLTLNISHSRLADLRIKIIAPSGRTAEIKTGLERASSNDDIRIPDEQLRDLLGEALSGTWSISIRDESLGVAGQLVGWNLKLNSQGAIEYFQRGLNIPDPVERETENVWFDRSGRYAVARAMQSDSARIWDLAFAEPLRAIALPESELLIGLDASARRLVTATQDTVNLWDTTSGVRTRSLAVGPASSQATLTDDGTSLFVERRGDTETRLELWDLDEAEISAEVVIAGDPALLALDATGSRVVVVDFDRAARVWDFQTARLLGLFDLPAQPSVIRLSADGSTLGAAYAEVGVSLWDVDESEQPLFESFGRGNWQFAFSPSGDVVAAGRPETGFQVFGSDNGRPIGPPLGARAAGLSKDLLSFSYDEKVLLTGDGEPRFWNAPAAGVGTGEVKQADNHVIWNPSGDREVAVAPDGSYLAIGDPAGHVHIIPSGATLADVVEQSEDVSFVGHSGEVRQLAIAPSGRLLASVAVDGTLRFWTAASGEPLPFVVDVSGTPVSRMVFSPDDRYLGLLSGSRVSIVETGSGALIAEFDAGSTYSDLTFSTADHLYLGAGSGVLQLFSRSDDNNWSLQQVWQSPRGIRLLRASPRGDFLVLVDDDNLASQFILSEGRIGDSTLQLPSVVDEVSFDASGSGVYFSTLRWVHRAASSASGLIWMDAVLLQRTLHGAGLVHGNGVTEVATGNSMYVPVARNGFVELIELSFDGSSTTGLFGSKDELLQEWRHRINATPPEEF